MSNLQLNPLNRPRRPLSSATRRTKVVFLPAMRLESPLDEE
jgi:hypothetical protein